MAGTRTGTPFRRYGLPLVCIGAVVALCYVMKLCFDLPTTTLVSELKASDGPGTKFSLKDGSYFEGGGKFRIGSEDIAIERIDDAGLPVMSGPKLVQFPNSFRVKERGANGTKVENHAAGTTVSPVATGLFFPENNASYGEAVDDLFYLILWITGIAFILTEGFFLYCIVMFWRKPGERALYSHGNHKLELAWTVVPALILVTLAIVQSNMWTEMKMSAPSASEPGVETVQIIGRQFKWYFRHAGRDARFGTKDDITSGEMFVPVDTPIRLEIGAIDVLHSFFLPNFRLKQDAVPGMRIPQWFKALRPGEFQVMCAELCGLGHSTMGTKLYVKSKDEFRAWVETESTKWTEENDGVDRPDWYGDSGKFWWWWDSNTVEPGYIGTAASR